MRLVDALEFDRLEMKRLDIWHQQPLFWSRSMRFLGIILLLFSISIVPFEPAHAKGKSMAKAVKQGYPNPRTKWGYKKVRGHVRAGKRSERFELRHGDCGSDDGWSDCENDRQRIERAEKPKDRMQRVGKASWYGWSMFLNPDFRDIDPANTTLGQLKMTGWREPIWFLNARGGGLRMMFANARECRIGSIANWRGRWVDIVLFADYSYASNGRETFAVWVNGKKVCSKNKPLVTQEMVSKSKGTTYIKYGVYNSYVSKWLNRNKTKKVQATGFSDKHNKSGLVITSATKTPFAYDWGVKLPTQVVFYDEMRYGIARQDVDIRLLEAAGARPVD
jgi:Polysaccharide lyase